MKLTNYTEFSKDTILNILYEVFSKDSKYKDVKCTYNENMQNGVIGTFSFIHCGVWEGILHPKVFKDKIKPKYSKKPVDVKVVAIINNATKINPNITVDIVSSYNGEVMVTKTISYSEINEVNSYNLITTLLHFAWNRKCYEECASVKLYISKNTLIQSYKELIINRKLKILEYSLRVGTDYNGYYYIGFYIESDQWTNIEKFLNKLGVELKLYDGTFERLRYTTNHPEITGVTLEINKSYEVD